MMDPVSLTKRGWTEIALGKLTGERGKSVNPSRTPEEQFELYSIPSFPTKKPELVSGKEIRSNKQLVESGFVLLGKINPRINRSWVVGNFSSKTKIASTEWICFPPTDEIEPHFLCYFLQQSEVRDFLAANASGVGGSLMRVKPSTIRDYPFSYPQRDKQREIVAEIEKQFTRLEAGVAALKRIQANLKRYRAAVLKAACEGKLVPTEAELARKEKRTYETGEQLLQRILIERRKNWSGRGKYKEPTSLDTKNLPKLKPGWAWATLDQLAQEGRPIIYGIIKPGPHIPNGVPYVRVTEMKDGRIDVANLRRTSRERASKFARATLAPGDVLISKDGTIGRVAVVPTELEGGNITQHVMRVPIHQIINRDYVVWAIRSDWCQHWLTGETRGVALRGVNVEDFRRLPIPFPPLAEQNRIVEEVERRLSVTDELESVVKSNLQRATRLRQSILQKAFTEEI